MTDKTNADEISPDKTSAKIPAESKTSRMPSKKLVAILLAGALVLAGGITFATVSVANAVAEETARQCEVALKDSASAAKARTASTVKADGALEQITSVTLPGEAPVAETGGVVIAWTSTAYADRAGAEAGPAVEAVPAVEASEGVEAVAAVEAVEAVPARRSGAEHIASVTDARKALVKIALATTCTERDEAESITALIAEAKTATKTLETSVTALLDDFAAFQVEEAARVAAEIEVARVAAEAAAAAEAARAAAAQRQAVRSPSRGTYTPPRGGGSPAPAPAPRPPGGGGSVGGGSGGGYCIVDNGVGGTTYVPAPC